MVYKKSAIDAPRGPPKFWIVSEEFLLKKPESEILYEINEINMYKDSAIRKKLKKFKRVFFI